MNLRDTVELWESSDGGEDAHGNPIPGTKRIGYLDENIAALDIHLTEDDRARIDAIFPPDAAAGTRYPAAGMSALNR